MAPGRAVNLRVRPVQSVDLCYPVDGIIDFLPDTLLGQSVTPFDLDKLYGVLGNTTPDGSRIELDSFGLRFTVGEQMLSALRAESAKADLDKAIVMRQNAYITTYSSAVVDEVVRVFGDNPADPASSMTGLLQRLLEAARFRHVALKSSYENDGVGVVAKTKSDTNFASKGETIPVVNLNQNQFETTSTAHTETVGYEYRYPWAENEARYLRSQISLLQEQLSAFRMREMCRQGTITFANEVSAMDQDIRKLQVAYLDTMLLAPFPGIVTGVFQNAGDFVRAGQPVLRVENDESVYLVGTIKYRGLLRVNSKVSVKTTLFDAPGNQQIEISGAVASVRGHDSVDEQWDVLILCKNRTSGGDALPLNYNFEFESTTVEVTA